MNNKTVYGFLNSRYGALTVFANDTGAGTQSLRTYGEWAENEISFLQHFVTSGCTVLDVGAYIGTHTLSFARFVGPTGRVIAIEAQPETFQLLSKNVAANVGASLVANGSGVVQLVNAVASQEPGQITIPTIDVDGEGSFGSASLLDTLAATLHTGLAHEDAASRQACVRAITIDSLDLGSCALIKVDVEGVENMVLRGAVQTLARCSPVVYCECNTLAAGVKSLAMLEKVHYHAFAHVVNAFNPDNYLNVHENIFGNAREVALVGVPVARADYIRSLPVRPFELLLEIKDADDLALALLNKPQYQSEVLRPSTAAKTGGNKFLDEYAASQLELGRLQAENAALQRLRAEEQHALEQRILTVSEQTSAFAIEKQAEIAELHALLTQRDSAIVRLQSDVAQGQAEAIARGRELVELHALLTQRDSAIVRLQSDVAQGQSEAIARGREFVELHALLTQRDGAIARLQSRSAQLEHDLSQVQVLLTQREQHLSQLHALLTQKETEIAQLFDQATAKDRDLVRIHAFLSDLYASNSWKLTKPLRWASAQRRRSGESQS